MRRRTTILAACSAVLLGTGGTAVLTAHAASAATTYGVAPYVDLSANSSGMLDSAITQAGLRSGPDGNGTAFLQAARSNGTRIDVVNIMTMDYGGAVSDMGAAAISAAKGTLSAARGEWSTFGYANLGITPMIGQNDQSGEVFTLNNARDLLSFANANGAGRLAFWSVGRAQPCPGGAGGGASPNCSSIAQNSLDFTNIFNGAAGGPPPPPPPSPTPTPTGSCSAPPWNAATAYNGGAVVSFNGHQYSAKWWTQGEE